MEGPARAADLVIDGAVEPLHGQEPVQPDLGLIEDIGPAVAALRDPQLPVGELLRPEFIDGQQVRHGQGGGGNVLAVIAGVMPTAGDIQPRSRVMIPVFVLEGPIRGMTRAMRQTGLGVLQSGPATL